MPVPVLRSAVAALTLMGATSLVFAHGDVTPQAMNTENLPAVGDEFLTENPYRNLEGEELEAVLAVGDSGYNQNCARCHGLGAVSGGIAPDLRYLEAEEYGDEWFMERYRNGYTQNGITRMPGFGELLGEEAGWAIRTYVEMRPSDVSMKKHNDALTRIRDTLRDGEEGDTASIKEELLEIAADIETFSGAPVADSIASRAVKVLDGSDGSYVRAADTLTIGLSAAR